MTKMPLTYEDAVSRIGELEAQLADIKNQSKREIREFCDEAEMKAFARAEEKYKQLRTQAVEQARKEERQKLHALWGEFSDSEDYDLVSDYWKRRFSAFFVSWP